MVRLNVSLKESLVADLRRTVPTRQRSRFISEALREKLERSAQERAVRAAAGLWSPEGRSDPEVDVRALREGWRGRTKGLED